ncbi:MAG: phosphopyruvate hydratase [Anaerolineae bacterium]
MSAKIKSIKAREILANRANLCLEVVVTTDTGAVGRSTPEAGVSTGTYEAVMLLDGEERYGGMGVRRAVESVHQIAPELVGMDVTRQREIDNLMISLDGTPNKSRLGANAIVGISLAVAKAAAASSDLPLYQYLGGPNACTLPMPIVGIGTGGRYRDPGTSRWFKPSYEFIAHGASGCAESLEICWFLRRELGRIMKERYGERVVGYRGLNDLGGLLKDDRELLDAMTEAIIRTGNEGRVSLYFDAAADCYYEEDIDRYVGIFNEGEKSRDEMIAFYKELVDNYPIVSIEDPLHEDDLEGHAIATRELGIEIVGDDLFTTNIERLRQAIEVGAANSMVLKITQVGTVSEAMDACRLALSSGYNVHPCGSRGDNDSVADFAVALNAGQVRAVDYNRLLSIEEELGSAAVWPGKALFKGAAQK